MDCSHTFTLIVAFGRPLFQCTVCGQNEWRNEKDKEDFKFKTDTEIKRLESELEGEIDNGI